MNSQYRLIVNIQDENDCAPKFTQSNYQFHLSKSSPIGSFIGQIQSNDNDDSPSFRRIQYQVLDHDHQNIINLDLNNGSLYLAQKPSTEMKFNMTVRAIDQHNHSLFDQTNIQINLFDETTCLPMFSQEIYVFNTTEHRITPYEIGKVKENSSIKTNEYKYAELRRISWECYEYP